jgi:hypothetical protein
MLFALSSNFFYDILWKIYMITSPFLYGFPSLKEEGCKLLIDDLRTSHVFFSMLIYSTRSLL